MTSAAVLAQALASAKRTFAARGFAGTKTKLFWVVEGGNTLTVALQSSARSSSAERLVTLNYGVYSARIGAKLQEDDESAARDVSSAHWCKRLCEQGQERWLSVKATDSVVGVTERVVAAFEGILPDLLAHSKDEALRDAWLAGAGPGLTAMQRLLYAAILVHELGPRDRLDGVLAELRGRVSGTMHEGTIERRLARALGA